MAKKRLAKKRAKQQQEKILSAQYTRKEIKQMPVPIRQHEEKRITRNTQRRQDRAETKAYLIEQGISPKIISSEKLYNRKKTKFTRAQLLQLKKQSALHDAGITDYKKSDLRKSWANLKNEYNSISIPENIRLEAQEYLYVGVAETREGFVIDQLAGSTAEEIKRLIQEAVESGPVIGSANMYAVFKVEMGEYSTMKTMADAYYERGFNMNPKHMKLDPKQYSKITISNRWNQQEFLSLLYNSVAQCKSDHMSYIYNRFKTYCDRNNLPFMDDMNYL